MYVEIRTYAVTRAMAEVVAFLPQGTARCQVELRARRTGGEDKACQRDVGLEHEGVDVALFGRGGPQGEGAGDVGGAVLILCSAIEQEESFGSKRAIGFGCGFVMNDGAVVGIAGDGVEANVAEEGLLGAERGEQAVDPDFGHASGLNGGAKAAQEAHQGYSVAQHGAAEAGHFGLVLHGLHRGDGRGRFYDVEAGRAGGGPQTGIGRGRQEQAAGRERGEEG